MIFFLLAMTVDYYVDLLSSLYQAKQWKGRMWLPQGHETKTLFTAISNISNFKTCLLQANSMKNIFV